MKPLLMNFAKEREDCQVQYDLRYSEVLDRNEIVPKSASMVVSGMTSVTQTRIKAEKPDSAPQINNPQTFEYLAAKTITEVKAEKPDVTSDVNLIEFLASKTFTKAKGEGQDCN